MPAYAYDSRLSAPAKWLGIGFADSRLKGAMEIMVRGLNEKVQAFAVPEGVALTTRFFTSEDGFAVPCHVFEPADNNVVANILYCHGGGFFLPVQPMMMSLACEYALGLSARVFLPQYRILPDYSNPYAFNDCFAVLKEIAQQDVPHILYGESVGATLAAGLSVMAGERNMRKANGQCLVYPVLDNSCGKYRSIRQYSEAAWTLRNHLMMWAEYLKPGMAVDEQCLIPMRAKDFGSFPKTYVEPQEIDIVRDEAVEFAKRLQDAGVPVTLNVIPGSYHGFDEDLENPFVQEVVAKRMACMKGMLD